MPEPKFMENFDAPAEVVEPTTPPPASVPAPEPKAEPTRMRELRRIEGGYQLLEREAADG